MVGVAALSGCPAAQQAGWTSHCPAAPPVCLSAVRSLASSLAGSEGGNNIHHHGILHVHGGFKCKQVHTYMDSAYPQTASCSS